MDPIHNSNDSHVCLVCSFHFECINISICLHINGMQHDQIWFLMQRGGLSVYIYMHIQIRTYTCNIYIYVYIHI